MPDEGFESSPLLLSLRVERSQQCSALRLLGIERRRQEPINRANAVAGRDGEGEYLDVMVLDQRGTNAHTDVALVEGKSQVVSVSSAARVLLLLSDGKEVARYPILLSRHEVNVVRP